MALALALRDRPVGRRLLLAALGGAGLSLIIELIQTTIPTRAAALGDWLLNTVGTGAGAVAASWMSYIFVRNGRPTTDDE